MGHLEDVEDRTCSRLYLSAGTYLKELGFRPVQLSGQKVPFSGASKMRRKKVALWMERVTRGYK